MNHDIIIHNDFEQGSDEWYATRSGLVTGSEFSSVLAQGKAGKPSVMRRRLINRLASERAGGVLDPSYKSGAMNRGNEMEAQARAAFEMSHGVAVETVGFVEAPGLKAGYSPDGFIGEDATIEIKTRKGELQIEALEAIREGASPVPAEHVAQVQGGLWITGRDICWLHIYWPGLPAVTTSVVRDEAYIVRLARQVEILNEEIDEIVERIKNYGN